MGGHQSKYDATNFETAQGGLTKTILSTQPPLSATETFVLRKESAMNKREYTVSDSEQHTIYTTKLVPGTAYWFDLLDKAGKPNIRIARTNMLNITWDLFSIDAPMWEGQECDETIAEKCKDDNAKLYRLGQFKFSAMGQSRGDFFLYQSSDEKDKRGVLDTSTSLLLVEKVRSMKQKFQTMTPDNTNSLIGYWDWSGNALQLRLAAGTDVALHSIAAVITHMIVMQQAAGVGAGAGAGTGAF